eukprot:s4093_g3.t1
MNLSNRGIRIPEIEADVSACVHSSCKICNTRQFSGWLLQIELFGKSVACRAHDQKEFEYLHPGLSTERVDPRSRALEAQSMQQIPKASRSCFVCYTCAAPSQVRKSDIRLQAPPPGSGKREAAAREYMMATHSNRLLGRMT